MKRATLILVLSCAARGQAPQAWTPERALQVQTIADVKPSPEGRLVVWTQRHAVMASEQSEYRTHLFLGAADQSWRRQLTRGEANTTAPAFSPDSRHVYFLSSRSGKPNLWRIPVDGGEAEPVTEWKGEMEAFRLSPDGKWIAFTGRKPSEEQERAGREKRDFRVIDENPANHSLWLVPREPDGSGRRDARLLTPERYHVISASGYTRYIGGIEWSPDSRQIAFTHLPSPGVGNWQRADISELDLTSGEIRSLASTARAEFQPLYSPDGRWLAYLKTGEPPMTPRAYRIVLRSRATGQERELDATADEWPQLAGWTTDSRRLILAEMQGPRAVVYGMPLDGPAELLFAPPQGTLSGITLSGVSISVAGQRIAMAMESSSDPPEAYVMEAAGRGSPVRVSRANQDLPRPAHGETRRIRWRSPDGLEVEGLLSLPPGYQAGQKYPLVLNVHGGPAAQFTETFSGRAGVFSEASFQARGFAVLRPNPRGSSGYGRKFRFANINDWGGGDFQDLMAGVDRVISLGIADPERLAVTGWSYGGFMTAWTVTQTHRFKAAVMGAGIANLWSMAGTSDVPQFLPDWFLGPPWENFAGYRDHSPLYYVKNVRTPTLILHGERDERVPVAQGWEFYRALKRLGVETKMVVYPRMPHGPDEPKFTLDIMHRHLDWIQSHMR